MPKRRKKPRFKTSFPLKRDEKGKVTPVEGVKGPFADTVKEKERYLEGEKEFRRKERERSERINQQIKETIKSIGSGIKKFAVKTLSGARGDAMRKRARELEKTIYPNRFIRRK